MALGRGQTTEVGAYANQRLNLAKLGRPMEEMPWFRTGPGKTGRPGACPGKAGVSSGGQTHRGKSQEPRSLDSGEDGNRISETYRQSHLQDGEQVIGP